MAKTSKAIDSQEVEETTEESTAVTDEIVELQWGEIENIFKMRAEMSQMEQYLANILKD